ncbi:aminodeoxychorismate lyase [Homoserinibacter sp. YIM 151385]|uniref:aminodeoxychorismate lyase n=1 Tax=Homoserinibacter sp. YIM 151385 TaxID=2985506 RepID=UPI0022F1287B|nr:aminodeoxychorismate lyase [Homoserinibacter sp. YIM 151385]WBU38357.1 aminodeoxychorismate lyase [Homoserinibacter sp. YIM 151385]
MSASVLAILDFAASPEGPRTLGHRLADPDAPQLTVADLAATRGDGVFETISIGRGRLQALEPHLARFARSAAMLDLPAPDPGAWRDACTAIAARLAELPEAFVKIVLTRGIEGGDIPTGWALGQASPDFSAVHRDGLAVALLDRGLPHDVAATSPWLLAGAKTLSYAVNRAAVREAARRGADDALFVSTDGVLLEGPVSNLVIRRGRRLSTPRVDLGILAGTTQADIFRWAEREGYETEQAILRQADLAEADAAWLVSSVRHAAPLRAVDGAAIPVDAELTARINAALRARVD